MNFKVSGTGDGATVAPSLLPGATAMAAPMKFPLIKRGKETTTICCYCAVGYGNIVTVCEDGTINI